MCAVFALASGTTKMAFGRPENNATGMPATFAAAPVLVMGAMNVAARGTCRLAGAWTSSRRAGRSTGLPFHALQVALVACGGDPA
jgi:hypothetical protein